VKGDPGEPGKDGRNGSDGKDGAPGKDGVGKDGRDGRDGLPGLNGERGADGADGRDAFRLDDITLRLADDKRTIIVGFAREGAEPIERALTIAFPINRGVWKPQAFAEGDVVTWGGSSFVATRNTTEHEKPEASDAWRLQTKRGRDGKDGKNGKDGARGKDGRDGVDGRNLWSDVHGA
jgi:integrin beta 3